MTNCTCRFCHAPALVLLSTVECATPKCPNYSAAMVGRVEESADDISTEWGVQKEETIKYDPYVPATSAAVTRSEPKFQVGDRVQIIDKDQREHWGIMTVQESKPHGRSYIQCRADDYYSGSRAGDTGGWLAENLELVQSAGPKDPLDWQSWAHGRHLKH